MNKSRSLLSLYEYHVVDQVCLVSQSSEESFLYLGRVVQYDPPLKDHLSKKLFAIFPISFLQTGAVLIHMEFIRS